VYAAARPFVRLATSIAVVVALTAQFQLAITRGNFDKVNFFSYFTVESNIAAAFVLVALEFRDGSRLERLARAIRPAVTLYMTMTGVIYAVLLAPATADVGLTAQWVDVIVHEIAPLVVFVDWILSPPDEPPVVRDIGKWLIFPVVYLVYSLVRGPIADWYPYPFLDPNLDGGAAKVAIMVVVLIPCVVVMAWGLVKLASLGRTRSAPAGGSILSG
jgi:hypothetical protein